MTITDTSEARTVTGNAATEPRPVAARSGPVDPAAPIIDVPLSEASQDLTGYEVTAIERHFGCGIEDLTGTKMLMGCIWAYQGRAEGKAVSWARVNEMTVRRMSTYFKSEPKDESEAGETEKD